MIQQYKVHIFCFIIMLLSPNTVLASGDIEIAGLGTLIITTQLMVLAWVAFSRKTRNIKLLLFSILGVVYSLVWLILWLMPSNWGHTKLFMTGLSIVPFIVGLAFNSLATRKSA